MNPRVQLKLYLLFTTVAIPINLKFLEHDYNTKSYVGCIFWIVASLVLLVQAFMDVYLLIYYKSPGVKKE